MAAKSSTGTHTMMYWGSRVRFSFDFDARSKGQRHRKPSGNSAPIRPGAVLAGLEAGPPCLMPPLCARTNMGLTAPLKRADLQQRRERGGEAYLLWMPPDDNNAA